MKKVLLIVLSILVLGGLAVAFFAGDKVEEFQIGTGYSAHTICSCVFVTERDEQACLKDLIDGADQIPYTLDREAGSVESAIFFIKSKAVFEEGKGCVLQ